jgi:hypothetical protein
MKQIRKIWTVLILLVVLTVSAHAAEFATADDLFASWEANGYPDYVSEVSSTNGGDELTVTLVAGYEDMADEVRSMVTDQSTLTIATGGAYSKNELLRVYEAIVQDYMEAGDSNIVGCGIGWQVVGDQVVGFGESGTESRVTVDVVGGKAEEYAELFAEQYGGMVVVEDTDGIVIETTDMAVSANDSGIGSAVWGWALLALCIVLAGGALLWVKRPALQTADGTVVTTGRITRAQVKTLIRESDPGTPKSDFDDLKRRISL